MIAQAWSASAGPCWWRKYREPGATDPDACSDGSAVFSPRDSTARKAGAERSPVGPGIAPDHLVSIPDLMSEVCGCCDDTGSGTGGASDGVPIPRRLVTRVWAHIGPPGRGTSMRGRAGRVTPRSRWSQPEVRDPASGGSVRASGGSTSFGRRAVASRRGRASCGRSWRRRRSRWRARSRPV